MRFQREHRALDHRLAGLNGRTIQGIAFLEKRRSIDDHVRLRHERVGIRLTHVFLHRDDLETWVEFAQPLDHGGQARLADALLRLLEMTVQVARPHDAAHREHEASDPRSGELISDHPAEAADPRDEH